MGKGPSKSKQHLANSYDQNIDKYCQPTGLYKNVVWDRKQVRKLIIEKKNSTNFSWSSR